MTLAWSPAWIAAENIGGGVTTYTDVPAGGPLTWHGPYPYLDTADFDWSGADMAVNTDTPNYYAAQRFAPSGPIASVSVQWQWNCSGRNVRIYLIDTGDTSPSGFYYSAAPLGVTADGLWHTSTGLIYDSLLPGLNAALARGDLLAMAGTGSGFYAYQVSFIHLTGTGGRVPINQQLQRLDGRGRGGVPLARPQPSNLGRGTF